MKKWFGLGLLVVLLLSSVSFGQQGKVFEGVDQVFWADFGTQYFLDQEGTLWRWGSTFNDKYEVVVLNKPEKYATQVVSFVDDWILKKDGQVYNKYTPNQPVKIVTQKEGQSVAVDVVKLDKGFILDAQNRLYRFDGIRDYSRKDHILTVTFIADDIKVAYELYDVVALIDKDNALWMWSKHGDDYYGISGSGKIGEGVGTEPTMIKVLDNVAEVISEGFSVFAITLNGDLYNWGRYSINDSLLPKKMKSGVSTVYKPSTNSNAYIQMKDGSLIVYEAYYDYDQEKLKYKNPKTHQNMVRPYDYYFLSADGNVVWYDEAKDVYETVYKNVDTFQMDSFMLYPDEPYEGIKIIMMKKDGYLWTSGSNFAGLLGTGIEDEYFSEEQRVMTDVERFFSAGRATYVLKKDGLLWGWGSNLEGELGDGTFTNRSKPVQIFGPVQKAKPAASNGISVYIDNVPLVLTNQPVLVSGRTLVPMGEFFSALGATVQWVAETRTVIAKRGTTEISIVIGSNKALVNGKEVTIDVAAQVFDGRTFVPLAFVSQALGESVEWKGETRSIYIKKN